MTRRAPASVACHFHFGWRKIAEASGSSGRALAENCAPPSVAAAPKQVDSLRLRVKVNP